MKLVLTLKGWVGVLAPRHQDSFCMTCKHQQTGTKKRKAMGLRVLDRHRSSAECEDGSTWEESAIIAARELFKLD